MKRIKKGTPIDVVYSYYVRDVRGVIVPIDFAKASVNRIALSARGIADIEMPYTVNGFSLSVHIDSRDEAYPLGRYRLIAEFNSDGLDYIRNPKCVELVEDVEQETECCNSCDCGNNNAVVLGDMLNIVQAVTHTGVSQEALNQAVNELNESISGEATERQQADIVLDGGLVNSFTYNVDTRVMSITRNNGSVLNLTLPQADETKAGLMDDSHVVALLGLLSDVSSLKQGGVWRATFATYADMLAAFPSLDVSGTNFFVNDWIEVMSDENYNADTMPETIYIVTVNGDVKTLQFKGLDTKPIATATNTSKGVVQGVVGVPGKIQLNTDGTQSLVGYDALVQADEDNANGLEILQTSLEELQSDISDLNNTIGDINTILDNINGEVILRRK